MIKFSLRCVCTHAFESWFASNAAYDSLRAADQVICPACGSSEVTKSIMAPNVGVKANRKALGVKERRAVATMLSQVQRAQNAQGQHGPAAGFDGGDKGAPDGRDASKGSAGGLSRGHPPTVDGDAPVTLSADAEQAKALAETLDTLRQIRDTVVADGDDVGERFPEEARKIHYGEADQRGIYGRASAEEVEALLDEGVEVLPMPILPEDHN
ncbi:MAG: DUF1178 family protein [Pseudomonadota bacterium]